MEPSLKDGMTGEFVDVGLVMHASKFRMPRPSSHLCSRPWLPELTPADAAEVGRLIDSYVKAYETRSLPSDWKDGRPIISKA
jgi:hypothetical protein